MIMYLCPILIIDWCTTELYLCIISPDRSQRIMFTRALSESTLTTNNARDRLYYIDRIIITNDVEDTRKLHFQQTEHKSNASPLPLMFCIHFYV